MIRLALALLVLTLLWIVAAFAQNSAGGGAQHERNNAFRSFAVTPSDSVVLANGPTSALYMGAAAACNITMKLNGDATAVLFSNVQPGEILPVQALLIQATGTTCTAIVALYDY